MTFWDYLILVLGAIFVVEGLFKGAVRIAFGLLGLFAGYLYAGFVATHVALYMGFLPKGARHPVALFTGFVLIFAACVLAGVLINKLVKHGGLGLLNRLLGAFLGLLFIIYLAGGLVRLSERVSPAFHDSLVKGPVVGFLSGWAVGLEALLPEPVPGCIPPPHVPHLPQKAKPSQLHPKSVSPRPGEKA